MADTDNSSYITRYNLISSTPEFFNGSDWYSMAITPTVACLPLTGGTLTGTLTQQKAPAVPTLAYTASTATPVTPNAANIVVYNVTVNANLTINGPTSGYAGQKLLFQLHNDASHAVTFQTGATGSFRFGADITAYTATASKTDYVGAVYNSTDNKWDIVSLIQGF